MKNFLESIIVPIIAVLILIIIAYFLYSYTTKSDKMVNLLSNNCILVNIPNEKDKSEIYCKKIDSNGKIYFEKEDPK